MEIKDGGSRQGKSLDQRFLDRSEAGVSGSSREQSGCRGLNKGEQRRALRGGWIVEATARMLAFTE